MSSQAFGLIAIPAVGAVLIAARAAIASGRSASTEGGSPARLPRMIALIAAVLTLCAVLAISISSLARNGNSAGLSGLSLCFANLTAAVWLPAVFIARECDARRADVVYGLLLLLESAFLGVFAAGDAVLFCLFLESSTVILFLLLGGLGGENADRIARKFLFFNLAGDLLILLAMLGLGVAAARMSEGAGQTRELSFSMGRLLREVPQLASVDVGAREYWEHARHWIVAALLAGLWLKTPLFPFHTWLATVVAEAPLCAGLIILGTGLRVGTYAFLRFVGPLLNSPEIGSLLMAMAALGALHTSFLAWRTATCAR